MATNIIITTPEKLRELIATTVKEALNERSTFRKEKELMNFKEVCELLNISTSTLNKWKRENKIPYKKLGKRVFFNRQDVMEALKDSEYHKLKYLQIR